jgi:hypothetical protein
VSGITGLLWDFFKWKTSGPAIEVSVKPGMEMMKPAQTLIRQEAKRTYIIVYIRKQRNRTDNDKDDCVGDV